MTLTTEIAAIQLAGGERVGVFDFYVRPTYVSLLAGKPNAAINERILERSAKHPQEWWQDKHPALVLIPSEKGITNKLPNFCMMVLLDSSTPLNPEYDGSMLRVVLFSDQLPRNLPEFLQNTLQHVAWQKNARDYLL